MLFGDALSRVFPLGRLVLLEATGRPPIGTFDNRSTLLAMKRLPVLDSQAAAIDVGSEHLHVSIAGEPPEVFGTFTGELERLWLCVRSERPWDVGRIWPLLVRFEHVELKPFHPGESLLLVEAAVRGGKVPADTLNIVEWLHRHAAGNPKILCELLEEIARGHYNLTSLHALRRLDLNRRIHEIFPVQ